MDNGLAGQQSIEQTDEKPWWFRRGRLLHSVDMGVLLCAGLLLIPFIHAWNSLPGMGLDDGWIHLTFARNLAQNHLWSINPAGVSGGTTSILWVLILAAGFFITDHGAAVAVFVNGILMLILTVLVHRVWCDLANKDEGGHGPSCVNSKAGIISTMLVLACGNLIWYAFTGMETLLVLVLGLAAIYCAAKNKHGWMSFFVFLGVLTRPDFLLIVPAIGLLRRREWRVWIQLLVAAGIGLLATGLLNDHLTGTFLPSTLSGRRWIIGESDSPNIHPWEILKNFFWLIGVWGYRLAEFTFGQNLVTAMGLPAAIGWTIAGIEMLVTGIGMIVGLRKRSFFLNALVLWAIFALIGYAIMLPTRGHGGRYQPMVLLTVMVFFVMGLIWLWTIGRNWKGWQVGICALAGISILSLATWVSILSQSLAHFDRVHIAAARWIDEKTSKDARVAGFDIGSLAYWGHRPIVDLGGLVDPVAGRALYHRTIPEYLQSQHAEYLVMIFPYTDPYVYFNDFRLDELERTGVLKPIKNFTFPIQDEKNYRPGDAARVLTNEIRIYRIVWHKNEKKNSSAAIW
ncbi:MAG: hypothetical protein GX629_02505 [Phycisphaerae bacterium]|nr:hypothetical protein [Phycisphaerae bacterium]